MTELIQVDFKSKEILYRAPLPDKAEEMGKHVIATYLCMVCCGKMPYDSWKHPHPPKGVVVGDNIDRFVCLGCINSMYFFAQEEYEDE